MQTSNFEKTIISIIASFKTQKEELIELKQIFNSLDTDKNGTLSKEELRYGLKNIPFFELLQNHKKAEFTFEENEFNLLME
jgi:Ca2+-binding EF-hand superfamily protein